MIFAGCAERRHRTDTLRASLSLGQLKTDGINARDIDAVVADRDGYENTTAHGTMSISLAKRSLWR